MKYISWIWIFDLVVGAIFFFALVPSSNAAVQGNPSSAVEQNPYLRQMNSLMGELKGARTPEARKAVFLKIRQAREQYRAAHPAKELTPAERAVRKQKMEEMLQKAPFQWKIYQLRQAMTTAKSDSGRDSIRAQMRSVREAMAVEAEARLTPQQRLKRQVHKEKVAKIRVELKPLMEQLRATRTTEERRNIRAQMMMVFETYR